ncbi:acetate kinase [bacterium]|nr:MAG: acetate kinase [bacterium]
MWDTESEGLLAKGLFSRIGIDNPQLEHETERKKYCEHYPHEKIDHQKAIKYILDILVRPSYGVIDSVKDIESVGHRVVHGGEKLFESILITDEVLEGIRECIQLAPLHNPANIMGIEACKKLLPDVPQVAVFDTAFHHTIEPYAYIYALPYELYEQYKVRRYGFHGTSHHYVANKSAELLGKSIDNLKIITLHLGNGASMTAVKNGKSVDTSMGFTPLEGLVMGTRTGDMDPALVMFLMKKLNLSPDKINDYLNKNCGLLGISGVSNDLRDILEKAEEGDYRSKLALDIYTYRIRKYIGSYAAALGGLDVLVFTAGVGENSPIIREKSTEGLEFLGVKIDPAKNKSAIGKAMDISDDGSTVRTLIIPTNEELVIASETERIVKNNSD